MLIFISSCSDFFWPNYIPSVVLQWSFCLYFCYIVYLLFCCMYILNSRLGRSHLSVYFLFVHTAMSTNVFPFFSAILLFFCLYFCLFIFYLYCLSFFSVSLSYFCLSFSFSCCLVVCPPFCLSVCLSVFLLDVNDVGSTDFGRNALPPTRSWKRH